MARAIDADELKISLIGVDIESDMDVVFADTYDQTNLFEIIDEAPTIEPEQKWISVKDDMPKEHDSIFARFYGTDKWKTGMYRTVSEDVIACLEAKNGHRMVKVLSTQDGDWKVNAIYQAEVTHWMPLPVPPKEG